MEGRHQEISITMRSILAFGDSNTWGLIPGSRPQQRFPWEVRWTGVLSKEAPGLRIIEEGLCGRTTIFEDGLRPGRRGLSTLPGILESQSPIDAAILMLGTNDCKSVYGASSYTIGKGIGLCLDEIIKYVDSSKILLISPINLGDDVWCPGKDPEFDRHSVEVSRELKGVYQKVASEHGVHFLPASDIVSPSPIDDEHLDEKGHELLARAVLIKLQQMNMGY